MKDLSKRASALVIATLISLPSAAQTVVLDNGIQKGTAGHFSVEVQGGVAVSSATVTTRKFDSPEIVTASLVSQSQLFVDPGNDGHGFPLVADVIEGFEGSVFSRGAFQGANGVINWNAFFSIDGTPARLFTSYVFFTPDSGPPDFSPLFPIGALRVFQYLDGDTSDGGDVLRQRLGPVLETLGNTRLFGVSQALEAFDGSPIPTQTQGAADIFNRILPRITGDGQPVSPNISVASLPTFVHPELGTVQGPGMWCLFSLQTPPLARASSLY